jgi:hypothetical protein
MGCLCPGNAFITILVAEEAAHWERCKMNNGNSNSDRCLCSRNCYYALLSFELLS